MTNLTSQRPIIIGVGGFTSNVGKTTLMCDLLRALPGWEAIKTTRGHYRSCGKDPHACCVSHLLQNKPVVQSGRDLTYSPGKDTGRYWDAGATNVHWVIATDDQIEEGTKEALGRVEARGVLIEGNSFTEFVEADFFIMVARSDEMKIKTTARAALSRVSALYLSGEIEERGLEKLSAILRKHDEGRFGRLELPVFSRPDLPGLVQQLGSLRPSIAA